MPQDRSEWLFWRGVAVRFAFILLVGGLMILWFQGCLVPLTKDEMKRDQEKATGLQAPPR